MPSQAPAVPSALFIFGKTLALTGNGPILEIDSPAPYVAGWTGTLDLRSGAAVVAADFAAAGLHFAFALSLRYSFDPSSNIWQPQAVQPTQTAASVFRIEPAAGYDPAAHGSIRLILGPLSIIEPAFNADSLVSGETGVMIKTGSYPLMPTTKLPLAIWSGGMLGLTLADASPVIELQRGFLTATLFAGRDTLVAGQILPLKFFEIHAPSVNRVFNGPSADGTFAVHFAPKSGDRLALHVDDRTLPDVVGLLQAPIESDQFSIELQLARDSEIGMTLQAAILHPAEDAADSGPRFLTHGFADQLNASVSWQALQPITLHLRPSTNQAPSTFLIADLVEAASVPVRCNATVIHGLTNETEVTLPAPTAGPTGSSHGKLMCEPGALVPSNGLCAASIARNGSAPWLKIDAASPKIAIAKAGHAYTAGGNPAVITHCFIPAALGLPALPFEFVTCVDPMLADRLHSIVDRSTAQPQYGLGTSQLETRMDEGPAPSGSTVTLTTLFGPSSGQDAESGPFMPAFDAYELLRGFGVADVVHVQPGGKPPAYVILNNGGANGASVNIASAIRLNNPPDDDIFTASTWLKPPSLMGLVKLDPTLSLDQIFASEPALANMTEVDGLSFLDLIDPELRSSGWTGLMLFGLPFGFDATQIGDLFPQDLTLQWVAVTPSKTNGVGGSYSVSGRIYWVCQDAAIGAADDSSQEVRVLPRKLDIGFFDGAITTFDARVDVVFASMFGLSHDETVTLELDGTYDRKSREIRLIGQFSSPLDVLPASAGGFGPFKSVQLTSAGVVHASDGLNSVRLSGNIVLQPFSLTTALSSLSIFSMMPSGLDPSGATLAIDFDNLDISVPRISSVASWTWCSIGYPNIKIDLSERHFGLGEIGNPFQLQIQSLALGLDAVDWSSLVPIMPGISPIDSVTASRSFVLGLRLDLMELPELADIDRLKLDFNLGFVPSGGKWSLGTLRAGLCAVGFRNFDVNLMRFLEISADDVEIKPVSYINTDGSPASSTWITFEGVAIQILGHTIIDGLTLELFSAGAERGFVCFAPNAGSIPPNGILDIDWILIGHNVEMGVNPPFWKTLVSPSFKDPGGEVENGLRTALNSSPPLFLPQPGNPNGAWIFAASFNLFDGLLLGKFLFQDRRYYGIAIGGGLLQDIFQSDVAISVAYIKGDQARDDSFTVSVRVPTVIFAGFTFLGGVITIGISMGGNLLLDIGFPWLQPDGGRAWGNTFGAIVAIGQGTGGAYIQKTESAVSSLYPDGSKSLTISGGYALQGGLGASFSAGIVSAWITAGYYALLEGSVSFDDNHNITKLELVGAIGILVRGAAELEWWIISVTIEIVASAEARGTLDWQSGHGALQLDFQLYADLSAQACIGGGWFKICRGISVKFEMDFKERISIG